MNWIKDSAQNFQITNNDKQLKKTEDLKDLVMILTLLRIRQSMYLPSPLVTISLYHRDNFKATGQIPEFFFS